MYKLIARDFNGKEIEIYSCNDIFGIDCITGEYADYNELFEKLEEQYGIKTKDVFIKYVNKNRNKIIPSIVFNNHFIPSEEKMLEMYFNFLRDDYSRINSSYLRNAISGFKNDGSLYYSLSQKMINYRTRRECYFHMIREGAIVLKEGKRLEDDNLRKLIENIDTESLDERSILIEKIKSGEIEPNYYDIDDYVLMKKRHR